MDENDVTRGLNDLARRAWEVYGRRVSTAEWYRKYFGELPYSWEGLDEVTRQAWRDVVQAIAPSVSQREGGA